MVEDCTELLVFFHHVVNGNTMAIADGTVVDQPVRSVVRNNGVSQVVYYDANTRAQR